MTETWVNVGESIVFSELLPPDCAFNSPLSSGQSGGKATVFRKTYTWKQLSPSFSYSFELNLFELGSSNTVSCVVIFPLKHIKDFLNDFSELLAEVMHKSDHINNVESDG